MLVFPSTPLPDELFPDPPIPGIPRWRWDGVKWVAAPTTGAGFIPLPNQQIGGQLMLGGPEPAATIVFNPYNGDWIRIDGQLYQIPPVGISAGPTVSIDGVAGQSLAADTVYYVYLFDNAGTLIIDFSQTGHQRSSQANNNGTEIKQGDNSRTLIGIVMATTGATPFRSALLRSWLNRGRGIFRAWQPWGPSGAFGVIEVAATTFVSFAETITVNLDDGITIQSDYVFVGEQIRLDAIGGTARSVSMNVAPIGAATIPLSLAEVWLVTEGSHRVFAHVQLSGSGVGSGNTGIYVTLG